ncbi:permease [Candidatus Peribacteria bacterium]|nr:permease [Candidatus Peribacteria bacterium]
MNDCCAPKHRRDWLLIICTLIIAAAYTANLVNVANLVSLPSAITAFNLNVFELSNKMWWGVALGILAVGVLAGMPKELVMSVLGKGGTFGGILRAVAGGVLLDLCSHGILLVGMQLYKRGASLGQLMAFLIASPWNSLSLTLILWALVGIQWTLGILALSLVIALISGVIFDWLVKRGTLPNNPNAQDLPDHVTFSKELEKYFSSLSPSAGSSVQLLKTGIMESKMILRWIFFGIVLAALIRATVPTEIFTSLFGPSLLGLGATLLFATILEVCSEGSMPVAADFLLRAGAPGNMFAFLMTGISTDYTEIMALKETTGHWKISLFLPLVTLPQVVLISLVLNNIH